MTVIAMPKPRGTTSPSGGRPRSSITPPWQAYIAPPSVTIYPSASQINQAATSIEVTQGMIAGANNVIPVVYGGAADHGVRIGMLIIGMVQAANYLYVMGVVSHGLLQSIDAIYAGDSKLRLTPPEEPINLNDDRVHARLYTGWPDPPVDDLIAAAYAYYNITFADKYPNIAWVWVRFPPWYVLQSFPNFMVEAHGKLVWDMRSNSVGYSNNPVLCLADYIQSSIYGMGRQIDVSSFQDAASYCDELVDGEKRSQLAVALATRESVEDWFNALVPNTGCICYPRGGVYYIRPNKARSVVRAFVGKTDVIEKTLQMSDVSMRQLPTMVTVNYTETSVTPFQTRPAPAKHPDLVKGLVAARESSVDLPGITRYSQAYREASLRLNQLQWTRTKISFRTFDEALALEPYDVVSFVFPEIGIATPKLFRIADIPRDLGFGRWQISLESYADEMFATTPQAGPPIIDGTIIVGGGLTAPAFIGPVTGAEELYSTSSGYHSRVRFSWPGDLINTAGFAYFALKLHEYDPETDEIGDQVDSRITSSNEFVSYALVEKKTYKLAVVAVSKLGVPSATIWSAPVTVLGKYLLPPQVPRFLCIEAGGAVYMNWDPAEDIDIIGYEIRRGTLQQAFDDMTLIDVVNALSLVAPLQPVGTWDYAIKAVDSVGNKSEQDRRQAVVVTVDHSGTVAVTKVFENYQLTNFMLIPGYQIPTLMNYDPDGTWDDGATPDV